MNSGKSTISNLLREKIENPAVVEIDEFRCFIKHLPVEETVAVNWENAALVARNYHNHGFNVIVPYPLAHKYYEYLQKELSDLSDHIYYVTLNPPVDVLVTNRGERELDDREIGKIQSLHERGIADNSYGLVIDNSNQTPEETVVEILEYIKGDK